MINKLKKHVRWMSVLLVASLLFGCGDGKQKDSDGLIRVDVSKSYPKKELILQDLFDIEYVPLETTDEFLTSGVPVALTEDVLMVRDVTRFLTGNLFLFDREGKPVKKINRKGEGGEEYLNTMSVVLDDQKNEIFVDNYLGRRVMIYDLDGNFKRSFEHIEGRSYERLGNLNQDYLICHDGSLETMEKRNFFMIVSKQDGKVKEIQIPYDKTIFPMITQGDAIYFIYNESQIPYKGDWFLMEPSSDTIYCYSKDHVLKPFIVRTPTIQLMEPQIFLYPGAQTDRFCFMQAVKKEFEFFEPGKRFEFYRTELVYDKLEDKIYEYTLRHSDFLDDRHFSMVYDNNAIIFLNSNQYAFLMRFEAPDLVEAYNDGKLRGPLKEIASSLDEEDNPVILIAKYKR